jgi:molecular chaperone GrpE (heat shock protein)
LEDIDTLVISRGGITMNEWIFENQNGETKEAEKSPSQRKKNELASLADRVKNNHRQLKESLERLQSSLDNLRLVTKYRVFDLEATRRENARLKKLLERDADEGETS